MKLFTSLLLGSAAGLVGVAGAQAADLPMRKAAPVEYVRICDAYGAGFFYIPGTDTCLKVGGLVLAEVRSFNPGYRVDTPYGTQQKGSQLGVGAYFNQRARDTYAFAALGRVELDARNATAWGTLRAFVRTDAYYGSGSTAATGSGSTSAASGNPIQNTSANTNVARFSVILNKGFIQFAGMTAGYAQSMFDFYADAYNYEGLRGSNATAALFAYTATFGGGFSATLSAEDQASRRTNIGNTVIGTAGAATGPTSGVFGPGSAGGGLAATPAGQRIPDVVGNLRVDQPWGAVQASAAGHSLRASIYDATAAAAPAGSPAFTRGTTNTYGYAFQLGTQFNLDMLAPGDKLWLQAGYERGAISYIDGSNLTFSNGTVNFSRYMGTTTPTYSSFYQHGNDYDCVFTASGTCEKQSGYAVVAAFKHYWIPTLSSGLYGSFMKINYTANATAGAGGLVGIPSWQEIAVGTNLVWTPVKGFDMGGEFIYRRAVTLGGNPYATGQVLTTTNYAGGAALPAYTATANVYEGRIRVQRAF